MARPSVFLGSMPLTARVAGEEVPEGFALQSAWVSRVAEVLLVIELLACDLDVCRVDHDDEVTGIDVRRVLGLALALEDLGDLARKPAQSHVRGIHEQPLALDFTDLGVVRLHSSSNTACTGCLFR
jgi:hypothetical protein